MDPEIKEFAQTVIDNIKKNGFPEKKVAFPIMKLYEAADKKGVSFNKVLEVLDEIQIAHVKTPEKIVFYAKDRWPMADAPPDAEDNAPKVTFSGNIDPSILKGMDPSQLMAAAAQMMQDLSPEQLEAAQKMYENMSEEERAELMEQAKKLGLL